MTRLLPTASLLLCACPPGSMVLDSGQPPDAAVEDAGHDAGRPARDAGVDAGWGSVAVGDWCRSLVTARCWRDHRCGRIDVSLIDDCVGRGLYDCDQGSYSRSAADGRLAYDAAQAGTCLDGFDHGSCSAVPAACSGVFTGRTPPDGGAFVAEDCDPDAGYLYAYDYQCPHRCQPWVAEGQPCSDSSGVFYSSCRPGLHACEQQADGGTSICMAPKTEGQACVSFDACAPGLVCSASTCVKQLAATGEPCAVMNGYPFCGPEDFCRQDPPNASGMRPPGVCSRRAGLGGACVGLGSCLPTLHCSSALGTGTCQRLASVGEPCASTYSFYPDCADGLWCPTATSRCAPYPGDGGDCSYDHGSYNACANGFYCTLFPDYLCAPKRADGEPCTYNDGCLSNECQYGLQPDGGYASRCVRCSQMADGG